MKLISHQAGNQALELLQAELAPWLLERSTKQDMFRWCRFYLGPINEVYGLETLIKKEIPPPWLSAIYELTALMQPTPLLSIKEVVIALETPTYNEEEFIASNLFASSCRRVHTCLTGAGLLRTPTRGIAYVPGDVFEVHHLSADDRYKSTIIEPTIHLVTSWSSTDPLESYIIAERSKTLVLKRPYLVK